MALIRCDFYLALACQGDAPKNQSALDRLVDSTGIQFLGEGEWKRKKHGVEYRRQWRKVHLGIDASTLEIRAIEVTGNSVGDVPMLPELLGQIPPDEALLVLGFFHIDFAGEIGLERVYTP